MPPLLWDYHELKKEKKTQLIKETSSSFVVHCYILNDPRNIKELNNFLFHSGEQCFSFSLFVGVPPLPWNNCKKKEKTLSKFSVTGYMCVVKV